MSGQVLHVGRWYAARARRARAGKAPGLALRRTILLRQRANGQWYAAVYTWRFGRWLEPEWLCASAPLDCAKAAARDAWRRTRLPALWHYAGERDCRPLRFGLSEPGEVA